MLKSWTRAERVNKSAKGWTRTEWVNKSASELSSQPLSNDQETLKAISQIIT